MPVFTDYTLQNNLTPAAAAAGGMIAGQQIQRQARQFEAWDAQQQEDQMFQQDIAALGQKSRPLAQDYFGLLAKYPQRAQMLTAKYEALDSAQRENMLQNVMPIYTAAYNGKHGLAAQMAEQQAQAAEKSGDMEMAKSLRQTAQQIKAQPEVTTGVMGATIARALGPERAKSVFDALNAPTAAVGLGFDTKRKAAELNQAIYESRIKSEEAATAQERYEAEADLKRYEAELAQMKAENGPMSFELDNQVTYETGRKMRADADSAEYDAQGKQRSVGMPVIPAQLQNKIIDWQLSAENGRRSAIQARELAQTFKTIGAPGGIFSTAGDWYDRAFGKDTNEAKARMALERYVNAEAIKMLPPGNATERDMELVLAGFPKRTSDSTVIAEYLAAAERISNAIADADLARAEWAETFGTLGKARTSGEVGGVQIMPGTSFNDYAAMKSRGAGKQPAPGGAQAPGGWSQRRYMR
jgi:hypothetical protein